MPSDESLVTALLYRGDHSAAAINWCEEDYKYSSLVAEVWNASSSLFFVVGGIHSLVEAYRLGLPWSLRLAALCCVLTGVASAFFHATLLLSGQRADELFENFTLVFLLHGSEPADSSSYVLLRAGLHAAVALVGILFVTAFLFTELHLIIVALLLLRRTASWKLQLPTSSKEDRPHLQLNKVRLTLAALHAERFRVALVSIVAGAASWVIDRTLCSAITHYLFLNPELHAWWHIMGALALHEVAACAAIAHLLEMRREGENLRVETTLFGLVSLISNEAKTGDQAKEER
jgi:dihydroceramidase